MDEPAPDAGPQAIRWDGTYAIEYTATNVTCGEYWARRRLEDERTTMAVESTLDPGIVRITFTTSGEMTPGLVRVDGTMTATIEGEYYDAAINSYYAETFTLVAEPRTLAAGAVVWFTARVTLIEEWSHGYEMPSWTCEYTVEGWRI